MIAIASAIEYSKPVFVLAYIFAFAGLFWSLGYWLTCDFLNKKNPKSWSKSRQKRIKRQDLVTYRRWKYTICTLIFALFILTCLFIGWIDKQTELSSLHGWLYPATQPLPFPCPDVPKTAVTIYCNDNGFTATEFPHTILKVKGQKRIVIDRKPDGALGVSLDVFDAEGKITASIENGEFTVNHNNILRMKRPDRSSLIVIDNFKTEVLNIRYLNPQGFSINAILYYPGLSRPIIINKGGRIGGGQMSESCFQSRPHSDAADIVIN